MAGSLDTRSLMWGMSVKLVLIILALVVALACTTTGEPSTEESGPPPTLPVAPADQPTAVPTDTPAPTPEPKATLVVAAPSPTLPATETPIPTATATATPRPTATPFPTARPLPTPTSELTPTPTPVPSPTPTPTPVPITTAIPTPTPVPAQGFGDGTWIVGSDIQPGTYAAGPGLEFCSWKRLSGFSGDFDDIIAIDISPRPIVTILATDAGFTSGGCNRWMPIADALTTPSGDGTWVVGNEFAPGTYAAGPGLEFCSWKRLSGFSGDFDDIIAIDISPRPIVTILATDAGFTSGGCNRWMPIADALTTPSGDGTWVVGNEFAPGTYSAPGSDFCSWKRLSGFSGDFDDIIAIDVGSGRQVVTIEETDVGFTSSGCGQWEKIG